MSATNQGFNAQLKDIAKRATAMIDCLVKPNFDEGRNFIQDEGSRHAAIIEAAQNEPIYAAMGEAGAEVALIHAQAIADYSVQNDGELPSDMLLASAHAAMENLYTANEKPLNGKDVILASVQNNISNSAGVPIITRTAALTLPRLLANPMNDFVTYIPVRTEEVELFELETVAGSTFGDKKEGDVITPLSSGQYSFLRQRFDCTAKGDGSKKDFAFDTALHTPAKKKLPFKSGSVIVYVSKDQAAQDDKDGSIFGKFGQGGEVVTATGDINYVDGKVTASFSKPLAEGAIVTVEYQVDIERSPELIPHISHKPSSFKLYPTERVLRADATIQAMFKMKTEHNLDMRSMNITRLRDFLASDDANTQLRDIAWHCSKETPFSANIPANSNDTWKDRFEYIKSVFMAISDEMMTETEESGLVGVYCGRGLSSFMKMLPSDCFKFSANYKQVNRTHFVGVAFGMFKIYECPFEEIVPTYEGIGYGKSDRLGRAPYYVGDVIAPTLYDHETGQNLHKSDTIWAKGFNSLNPKHGKKYLHRIKLTNFQSGE